MVNSFASSQVIYFARFFTVDTQVLQCTMFYNYRLPILIAFFLTKNIEISTLYEQLA